MQDKNSCLCYTREVRVACFPQELDGNPARRAGWPASIYIYMYTHMYIYMYIYMGVLHEIVPAVD